MEGNFKIIERTVLAVTGLLWPLMVVAGGTVFLIVAVAPWERYRQLSEQHAATSAYPEFGRPSISIRCEPEQLPLRGTPGESLYVLRLHPKWGDALVNFQYTPQAGSYWPSEYAEGIAYRCMFKTSSNVKLLNIVVPITIVYEEDRISQPSRTAEPTLPVELSPTMPIIIHVFDDTGWMPAVKFPRTVIGRIAGEVKTRVIPVDYFTRDGAPLRLTKFN